MKRNIFIILGLSLLLVVIIMMMKDFFFSKTDEPNPYEYKLDKLTKADTTKAAYTEIQSFTPKMEEIHGLALGAADQIFVAGEGAVEIYSMTGSLLNTFKVIGTARCIHIAQNGNIYLGMDDHLEVWTRNGKLVKKLEAENQESVITSIATNGEDLFVADAGMRIVYHYDPNGRLINRIGDKDPQNGIIGFVVPSAYFDLNLDKGHTLWVANPGNHRLEQYDFHGKFLSAWGTASMTLEGFCGCCNPSNFAFLSDGSFVTSEKGIERIKVYTHEGKLRSVVAFPASFEEGTRGLDLAVDSQGRILVLDPVKKQIRIFVQKKTP